MAAGASRVARTAHLGRGALRARPRAFQQQARAVRLVDGLMPLERIPSAEVLATGWAFVLLVGVVDAFVPFEMLALASDTVSAADLMA